MMCGLCVYACVFLCMSLYDVCMILYELWMMLYHDDMMLYYVFMIVYICMLFKKMLVGFCKTSQRYGMTVYDCILFRKIAYYCVFMFVIFAYVI